MNAIRVYADTSVFGGGYEIAVFSPQEVVQCEDEEEV